MQIKHWTHNKAATTHGMRGKKLRQYGADVTIKKVI